MKYVVLVAFVLVLGSVSPVRAREDEPPYAKPAEIENLLSEFLAQQPGLEVVSITSVECTATSCEIALGGTDPNPQKVGPYGRLFEALGSRRWQDFRILSGSIGTREITPGAREYVMRIEYQPLSDLSNDPVIAARQQAACAAAWRRMTENPTPAKYVRQYLETADEHLRLAAKVLGEAEAERLAALPRGGPVIRECGVSPPP